MFRKLTAILVLAIATASPAVYAKKVYLNGVDITKVRDQTFLKANVTIDKDGDIYIDAPGYKVEVLDPNIEEKPQTPSQSKGGPNTALQKRYFLVTQPSKDGRAQYDFIISVNGAERKTIKAGEPQVIMEISVWLHKGENEINIKGIKDLGSGRKSSQKTDEVRVVVGIGHEEGKKAIIDAVKASVKADASDLSNIDKHFVLTAE
jgi:hypothetical protein